MEIRQYQSKDRAACIAIFRSNTPQFFAPSELKDFEFWLDAHDERRGAYANYMAEHYYVAEQNGEVLACGGFGIAASGRATMVWGMVANANHKQGIGKALFKYRIGQVAALYPGHAVILDTSQHSYGFFQKQGFTVTGIKKDYYGPGLDRYDMVWQQE